MHWCIVVAAVLIRAAAGQSYFPPSPENVTVIRSKYDDDVSISYKQTGICETTPGVNSYAGYVHMNETTNTFFWFFEARTDPANAPLSLWMNGGPGSSSMIGLLQELGPCKVRSDSNSTVLNSWAWNNEVNMLFIDQPVKTGFSYTTLVNVTNDNIVDTDPTTYPGTKTADDTGPDTNTTQNAARVMWHFAQTWLQEFPQYKPNDDRVSIWTESYGGLYGPAFSAYFQEQNERIDNGSISTRGETYKIHLDTLGIINGCVDELYLAPSYPEILYNNTYGVSLIDEADYQRALSDYSGCSDAIQECRTTQRALDPDNLGNVDEVSDACGNATAQCSSLENVLLQYTDRGYYDFAHPQKDPFPPPWYQGFLNQDWVQRDLGVPLNFTSSDLSVFSAFATTGDSVRGGILEDIAYLLESGVKVAMVYGDRDYICNWIGGENASLAVPYRSQQEFASAGYADVVVNGSYNGGLVRQYGNFSFTRVYQAGHEVPAYQPETAFEIFRRVMGNVDIATGTIDLTGNSKYSSEGNAATFDVKNVAPPLPEPTCYVLDSATCENEVYYEAIAGNATVKNYIVMQNNTESLFDDLGSSDPITGDADPSLGGLSGQYVTNGSVDSPSNSSGSEGSQGHNNAGARVYGALFGLRSWAFWMAMTIAVQFV